MNSPLRCGWAAWGWRHRWETRIRRVTKYLVFVIILLAAHAAAADDFLSRAAAGRAASNNAEGSKYDISLWPILKEAGAVYDPPGMVVPPDELGQYGLVGDIDGAGAMVNVEIRPDNKISECFAAQMEKARFANPPLSGRSTYPILVDLTVTP